jgi:thioredoxin-related protein
MIAVTLYSRKDCHLCEQTKADLHDLQEIFPHRLIVVDVDNDQELQHKYGSDVPVLEIGPYTLKAPISLQELKMTLGAALDI